MSNQPLFLFFITVAFLRARRFVDADEINTG